MTLQQTYSCTFAFIFSCKYGTPISVYVVLLSQRRGLFRKDYTGTTLRYHLGLPRCCAAIGSRNWRRNNEQGRKHHAEDFSRAPARDRPGAADRQQGAGGGVVTVARHVVNANLAGRDSHGVIMLPNYIERVR